MHGRALGRVQWLQGLLGVEVARRDRVGVLPHEGLEPLMDRARHVDPAELVDWGIEARARWLLRILGMVARCLELQLVVNVVGRLTVWLTAQRKAGEILHGGLVEVERQQRLGVPCVCLQ